MNGKVSVFDIALTVLKYVLIAIVIMFFISRAHEFYDMGYGIFMQKGIDEEGMGHDVSIVITNEGDDANALGRLLEGHGLIENRNIFRVQELFSADNIVGYGSTLASRAKFAGASGTTSGVFSASACPRAALSISAISVGSTSPPAMTRPRV